MPKRLIYGLIAVAGIAVAIYFYGHAQYRQGVNDERVRQELAHARLEQGLRYERDKADAKYRAAVAAREVAQTDLDSVHRELERVLTDLRHAQAAGASGGPDDAGVDGIGILIECIGEYEHMGTEAARLADKVGGLQGHIQSLY